MWKSGESYSVLQIRRHCSEPQTKLALLDGRKLPRTITPRSVKALTVHCWTNTDCPLLQLCFKVKKIAIKQLDMGEVNEETLECIELPQCCLLKKRQTNGVNCTLNNYCRSKPNQMFSVQSNKSFKVMSSDNAKLINIHKSSLMYWKKRIFIFMTHWYFYSIHFTIYTQIYCAY